MQDLDIEVLQTFVQTFSVLLLLLLGRVEDITLTSSQHVDQDVDVDVQDLRAQANASVPASYIAKFIDLISNTNFDFRNNQATREN